MFHLQEENTFACHRQGVRKTTADIQTAPRKGRGY
jgi:hypothetical protein